MHKKLIPNRKLHGTVDKCIQLIAASKTLIKQLSTVRLSDKENVCLFYLVPDMCCPIFGLLDLTIMTLLTFDIPLRK